MSTKLWSGFYVEIAFRGGGAACPHPLKFELRIAQEGRVYKIWDLVYKIIQNEQKIMIQFFILNLHLGCCMSPAPKFELRKAQEGRVYKIWDLVHEIVQNKYKIMIYFSLLKFVFFLGGRGGDMHLENTSD